MNDNKNPRVVAFSGLPGSGKTEAVRFARSLGRKIIRFGSFTDKELQARGLPKTEQYEKKLRENLRKKYGMAAYAIKAIPVINKELKRNNRVVIDGLRSWEEYEYLQKKIENLTLIAIITPAAVRYKRLSKRSERPLTQLEARERDRREMFKLNICPTILLADVYILNTGTRDDLYEKIKHNL